MKPLLTALALASMIVGGCASPQEDARPNQAAAQTDRFELRVALFPWIPANGSFARWVEHRFEAENRDIDLVVLPMDRAEELDFAYDIDATTSALTDPANPNRQHLIEIDTLILGALVAARAVQPFEVQRPDYFPFAREAVRLGGTTYGVPHWTCGYFIMTTSDDVAAAHSAADLRSRLERLGTGYPDLGGDIEGSWDSVIVYLDAYFDTYPRADSAEALDDASLDERVRSSLDQIGEACTQNGEAFCNRDDGSMVQAFASGRLDALIGYSERLNPVFSDTGNTLSASRIRISPAPLGEGKQSFLFTDALVLSPLCADTRCRDAARRFARFYVADAVFETLLMGQDQGTAPIPRYLLPSTAGALSTRRVAADPIYRQLRRVVSGARAYPNHGVPEARRRGEIRAAVEQVLHRPR